MASVKERIAARRKARRKILQRFRVQGSVVEYKCGVEPSEAGKPPIRGQVKGFTRAARLRLLKRVATIDWQTIPQSVLITLTYPDELADRTFQQRGQDRYLFMRKLERYLDRKVCGIWRTEFVPRRSGRYKGMLLPHLHLLVFGVTFVPWQTVRQFWKEVIHKKGYCRTEIKRATSPKMAGFYVAKYMSKTTDSPSLVNSSYLNTHGRAYGYHRPGKIPQFSETWISNPSIEQIQALLDYAKDCLPWLNRQHQSSYTLLGRYADHAKQILQTWGLTDGPYTP